MIPGNVEDGQSILVVKSAYLTVYQHLVFTRPDWVRGMGEAAIRARLLACMIPPDSPYVEWEDVLSRCAYPLIEMS